MSKAKRKLVTAAAVGALLVVLPLLAFAASCPVCGGRVVKIGTLTDATNAPSRNLCGWDGSICGNLLYGPDSLICTGCWLAHSKLVGNWERAAESPATFRKPLSRRIFNVPVPSEASLRSGVVFTQSYAKKTFAERVTFWCVDNEIILASLKSYCATNGLSFNAETNRIAGQVYVKIE
jgi:hypothetical protein